MNAGAAAFTVLGLLSVSFARGASDTPFKLGTFERNGRTFPGLVLDVYRSARASIGTHRRTGHSEGRFPGSGTIDIGHDGEGEGDYVLTYSIRRAR